MKIVIRIVIVLAAIVAVVAIVGMFMPSKMHIERTAVLKASPEVIYGQVNDLKTWDKWAPWNRMDPNWKVNWGNVTSGEGATYSWASENSNVGHGSMTIIKSIPSEEVQTELTFEGRDKANSNFKLEKVDGGTKVTWSFDGDAGGNPFMHIMASMMDKMMGPVFEQGLSSLDSLTASIPAPTTEMTITPPADSSAVTK